MTVVLILLTTVFNCHVFAFFQEDAALDFNEAKKVSLNDNGLAFETETAADSVSAFLKEKNIIINEQDLIIPEKNSAIFSGMNIFIKRALKIKISADGKEKEFYTLAYNVSEAIADSGINLGEDDLAAPAINAPLKNNLTIAITRVKVEEEIIKKDIAFKTISEEDDKLGWRVKKVKQKGEKGAEEIKYKVVSHDGKEISRKIITRETTKEPTAEIVIQGTFIKTGKAARGDASYYASSWGELNASRTIPRGGYAKVTNLDNGKSVIVKINDFGPISKQRIIDLSHASFSKIGDLGQGIMHNVKVEQILN